MVSISFYLHCSHCIWKITHSSFLSLASQIYAGGIQVNSGKKYLIVGNHSQGEVLGMYSNAPPMPLALLIKTNLKQ